MPETTGGWTPAGQFNTVRPVEFQQRGGRQMRALIALSTSVVLAGLFGCSSSSDEPSGAAGATSSSAGNSSNNDADSGTPNSGGTSNDSPDGGDPQGSAGTAGGGDAGSSNSGGSGDFLTATGTVNGVSFSVDCDLADPVTTAFASGMYKGHPQCSVITDTITAHIAICRADQEGIGGLMGQLAVNVTVSSGEGDSAVSLSDTLGGQINQLSANSETNDITVDALEPNEHVDGSFTAEWSDDGSGFYGDVTGTFSFDCPPP
jgi:hypothetical protein